MTENKILSGKCILLVDDDDALRASVGKLLEHLGARVLKAPDGKIAQNLISLEPIDLVISDIRMPNCNGIELLHFVKKTKPTIPVVLTTGFGELKETTEAYELGARGFLAKPFNRDDLRKVIVECVGAAPVEETHETDDDYSKLSIDDFVTGKQIKFDIFIRLGKDKFVKIAHEGDDMPVDRVRAYKSKNITHLYMRQNDFARYMGVNVQIAQKLKDAKNISNEKKINFMKHTGEVVLERVFLDGMNEQSFEMAKTTMDTTMSFLLEVPDMATLLESLNNHSDHLYAHCLGVSIYASMIARALNWENPRTMYKISMAGLLHDIGKKEFDPALLKKTRGQMTAEEVKIYHSHPSRGVQILSEVRSIPGDIIQIVQEHHENCLGTGWPSGLKKNHIHPMAKVVHVADVFSHMIIKGTTETLPLLQALEQIYITRAQEFDPQMLEALVNVFNPTVLEQIKAKQNAGT